MKVSADLVSSEVSLLSLQLTAFCLSSHDFSVCVHITSVSSSYKGTRHVGLGPQPSNFILP